MAEKTTLKSNVDGTNSMVINNMAMAINKLAVSLHRLMAEEKSNVFFSPYSISSVMAMVYWAAEGETGAEMKKALGYAEISKDDIVTGFEQFMSSLTKNNDSCTLSCANTVISQKSFYVKEKYKSVLKESFKALFLELDMRDEPDQALQQINDWVKDKTNGKISEILPKNSLDPNIVMMLLNAVYFKGSWLKKFKEAKTYSEKFYNKGDKKNARSIKTMHMKEKFRFVEDKTFQALQLPYAGEEIAMMILLPREMDGLKALEATISPTFIQDLNRRMFEEEVTVALPRFRLEYSASLIPFFERLGVDKLFKEGADLRGFSDCNMLLVTLIEHKAVLEVNEEGSEASAATAVKITMRCLPESYDFIVDHPFAFVIYDVKRNLILFMGRVEEL